VSPGELKTDHTLSIIKDHTNGLENPEKKIIPKAYIFLFCAVLSWAINTVLAKGMIRNINPMALSFFRWLTALMVILPFGFHGILKEKDLIKENFRKLIILTFFSVSAYNSILYFSAKYTTATNISFVTATVPAFTFIISWILLGEKVRKVKISGMILSLIGLLIIIFQGSITKLMTFNLNIGDLIVLLSVLSWAVYSVLLKKYRIRMDPVAFLTLLIILGLPMILPFYLWELMVYGFFKINTQNVTTLLFIGIFPSVISYICWNKGVSIAGPNTASMFMYLIPVFASFIAWVFLDERLHVYHITGGITTFTGLYLAVRNS